MIQGASQPQVGALAKIFGESGGFVSIVYQGRENTVGTVSTVRGHGGHAQPVFRKPADHADGADANVALREVALMAVATFRLLGNPSLLGRPDTGRHPASWLEIATVPEVS